MGINQNIRKESRSNLEHFCKEICTILEAQNLREALSSLNILKDLVPTLTNMERFFTELHSLISSRHSCSPTPVGLLKSFHKILNDLSVKEDKLQEVVNLVQNFTDEFLVDEENLDNVLTHLLGLKSEEFSRDDVVYREFSVAFMNLFGFEQPELNRMVAFLNKLYLKNEEYSNFIKNIKDLIGLDYTKSTSDVEVAVSRLINLTRGLDIKPDDVISAQNVKEFEKLGRNVCSILNCSVEEVFRNYLKFFQQ
ncbi:hypothetical protein GEMRC1_003324 [Eukaryota sp. GEM-RC1]